MITLLSSCLYLRFHVQKLEGEQMVSTESGQIHTNELKNKTMLVKEMANAEFLDLDRNLQANWYDLLVEKTDSSTRNHLIFYVIFKLSKPSLQFYCP